MSVLLWWLPALIVVAVAWWRARPQRRSIRDKDLRTLARLVGSRR